MSSGLTGYLSSDLEDLLTLPRLLMFLAFFSFAFLMLGVLGMVAVCCALQLDCNCCAGGLVAQTANTAAMLDTALQHNYRTPVLPACIEQFSQPLLSLPDLQPPRLPLITTRWISPEDPE